MAVAAAVLVGVGVGVAVWLLIAFGSGTPSDSAKLDAIKTAGTIVVGTGGAGALWLAARRQRTGEIALKQRDLDHALQARVAAETKAHQERVADDARQDAAERRVTELYTKAADQLGSDKAPVRLAGLYALERLAQSNPEHRQTVVNVLCAYLRMPYAATSEASRNSAATEGEDEHQCGDQEKQVRLAAQRILTSHLRPGQSVVLSADAFWGGISLDLAGAALFDFDLTDCHLWSAQFTEAQFAGRTRFERAQLGGRAVFDKVRFGENVAFDGVRFGQDARFGEARFGGEAGFTGVEFAATAWFDKAEFGAVAWFDGASFGGIAWFDGARFNGVGEFSEAAFLARAGFRATRFAGPARFNGARFGGEARFGGVQFGKRAEFTEARARLDVPTDLVRSWPDGYGVAGSGLADYPITTGGEGRWGDLVLKSRPAAP